jgi:hypothetical protein
VGATRSVSVLETPSMAAAGKKRDIWMGPIASAKRSRSAHDRPAPVVPGHSWEGRSRNPDNGKSAEVGGQKRISEVEEYFQFKAKSAAIG